MRSSWRRRCLEMINSGWNARAKTDAEDSKSAGLPASSEVGCRTVHLGIGQKFRGRASGGRGNEAWTVDANARRRDDTALRAVISSKPSGPGGCPLALPTKVLLFHPDYLGHGIRSLVYQPAL
jgi:hypothetical protein